MLATLNNSKCNVINKLQTYTVYKSCSSREKISQLLHSNNIISAFHVHVRQEKLFAVRRFFTRESLFQEVFIKFIVGLHWYAVEYSLILIDSRSLERVAKSLQPESARHYKSFCVGVCSLYILSSTVQTGS